VGQVGRVGHVHLLT